MPSVMVDVDYKIGDEDRNITERSSIPGEYGVDDMSVRAAINLLDAAYGRARARLIGSLSDSAAEAVPIMVPVPEYALTRVQACLSGTFTQRTPEEND